MSMLMSELIAYQARVITRIIISFNLLPMYFSDLLQKQYWKIYLLLIGVLCSGLSASAQDYSDAPTSYGSPSHSPTSLLYIGGTAPDNEGVALPTTNANGDNVRGINDENTFTSFPALNVSSTTYTISSILVFNNTGNTARLTAWIDFNRNGVFDANEGVQSAVIASSSSATTTSLTWTNIGTSPDISPGKSFIRFRLTTNPGVTTSTPSTATTNGEVEDYVLTIGTVSNTTCAGTGQSITTFSFQNPTLESGTALTAGAVYRFPQVTTGVDALVRINALVNTTLNTLDITSTGEASAFQPTLNFPTASTTPSNIYAEFQISFVAEGTTTSYVQFTTVNATGIDIDGDDVSTMREYQEFPNLPSYVLNGATNVVVSDNGLYKRFTAGSSTNLPGISTSTVGNAATGVFNNISSFTYRCGVSGLQSNSAGFPRLFSLYFQCVPYTSPATTNVNTRDYGDAPNTYGTLASSSGASHIYTNNLKLGVEGGDTEPDGFNDGTPSGSLAQDDDLNGNISGGDEASVDFIRTLYTNSSSYSIAVTASNNTGSAANLRAWLDFNRNGVFDSGEASSFVSVATGATNQVYVVTWPSLTGLSAGQSFLRVRLTTGTLNTTEATGAKNDGEVEDYAVTINTGNPQVSVSGTVLNDVNGINNSALDGAGTNTGGTLYALLVSGTSEVAVSVVQPDGSYTFNNITAGTYTVRLSTTTVTVGTTAPAASLPSGWVNTSEAVSPAFNDGTVDGNLSITVGTNDFSGANFGIDHLPTPGSGTATVTNTGGTNPVIVPPSAFTSVSAANDASDTPPGSVTAIRVTAFPSNTTSLTVNGTTYASLPSGGIIVPTDANGAPTVPILVDPTNDSNPVSFSFVAIDNASKESTAIGTAVINSNFVLTLSGSVWNDADGNLALNGSEAGTNAGGPLYVNLVSAANTILASTTVSTAGVYSLTNVPASTAGLRLVLTGTASSTAPGGLPTGWVNTGESVGPGNTATQSAALGQIELSSGTVAITAQNFGIEQLPTPGSGTAIAGNAGGSSAVTVPPSAFTSTTPSTDTAPGTVTAIRITAFPSNTTSLTVNGSIYTSLPAGGIVVATNSSGAPSVTILVDPTNDSNPVSFSFVAIDNAGKESATAGTAVLNSSLVLTLSGTVWNDADGNLTLNGSETGTNAGGPLFVNLVSATNTVIASTTVSSTGSYTLAGVPASTTGLKLVLTGTASSTAPGGLPTNWVNTGESVGPGNTATQSSVLGQIELSTTTVAVTAQNFGIEQVPSAGSGSATVVNTGGTNAVTVPPSAFTSTAASTDTAPGSVTAIRITAFPSNTTSLTVNGSVYSSLPSGGIVVATNSSGAPSVAILVDPTNDSNPVSFSFVAIDNAGKESTATGTAVLNSSLVLTVSGTVWNDADGNLALNGSETGTNASGPLFVNLVNGTGAVVASTSVNPNGSYTLGGVPASSTGLRLVLTSTASSVTPGGLPTGWVNTGESVGSTNSATQSSALGQIELSTTTVAVTAQNFGIEQVPSAGSGSATVVNTGGSSAVTVPPSAFTSTTPSTDTAPGSVTAIRITAFPSNTTSLTINGTAYASLPTGGIVVPTDGSGAPSVAILVDPTNDSNPVSFSFVAVDNAGKESATSGTAVLNSSLVLTLSGSVWNDADGNLTLNGSETGTNAGGPLFVNLVSATNTVIASTTVSSTGSYTLSGVPASTAGLKLVLTNSASSTTPGGLPTGWTNTGESVGPGNSATQSSALGLIELSSGTVAITAQNFGIEQLPSAGSGSVTLNNSGGNTALTLPASAFTSNAPSTDTAPGSVTAIRISSFPGNVSSLTINGSVYSVSSFPAGGVVVPTDGSGAPSGSILIDPTNDSSPVVVVFVAIDNAGKESLSPGTATLNSSLVLTLSGTVWNDADGNLTLNGSETGTNAGGPLFVNLVSGTGAVVSSGIVGPDGSYSLGGVPASSTGLRLVLTGTASSSAAGGLPAGWVNTGESVGSTNTATQSSVLGQIELSTGTVAIVAQNFGIEQVPSAGSGSATVVNTGGTNAVTVPPSAFTSTAASTDTAPGSVTAIRITAFPSNTTSLTVNGSVYSSLPSGGIVVATNSSGAPSVAILVDPTNDSNPVSFSFVAIDNAGKESTATGTAVLNSSLVLTVSGTVWNDADGNLALNGSETGTNASGPLFVNLVNGTGAVVASTSVNPNGSYTLGGVPASSTGLRLVLTSTASSVTPGGLPTNWVNTGESVGSTNTTTQSSVLGQIELSTTTVAVTAQNFGIEQLPTPGSGIVTVTNTGGSSAVTVPPSAFTSTAASTDTAPGSVTAIRITAFPSNTTSLTVNGSVYSSLPAGGIVVATNSSGAPSVAILVDPTDDSNPVSFSFVAIDNAGKESTTSGTAVVNSGLVVSISGSVWNDADGNLALNGSETGTNAGGPLYVTLVNNTGVVVASTSVNPNGSYSLGGVPASSTGLRLVLTGTASSSAAGGLPTGWVNTGESVGSGNPATQSSVLGQIELSTTTVAVTAQNFGIEQLPTSGSGSATVVNTGGSSAVTVPPSAFTSTTPSTDTVPGSVTAIRITAFPSNTTSLTINGTAYASLPTGGIVVPTDGSGAPSVAILVDPTNDSNPVVFSFVAIDNAGKESLSPGTATLNSSLVLTLSGSVWNDADGNLSLNGTESGTNAGGPLYVNLISASNTVIATGSVGTDGSYTLSGVPASTAGLKLVLTNSATATTPGGLPTGWTNTGESVGSGNSATQSSALGLIELSSGTIAITAQNFGIEQLPSAGSGSVTVNNSGGNTAVTLPASAFTSTLASTDTAPGSVTAIRISVFPGNVTSLTVNGSVYNSSTFPAGGIILPTDGSGAPSGSILIDPTNDSSPVVVVFVAIDNAGKESLSPGTATLNSSLVLTVSGTVWNDADGNLTLNGSETGTNAGGPLYVNLVSGTGAVVASGSVGPDGSYSLGGVPASSTGLRLVLTGTASSSAAGGLPAGWVNTGESVGSTNTATQSSVLGQIELSTTTVAVTAQNFGIEQVPSAGSGSATVVNTGGSSAVTVPPSAFTSTTPSTDTAPGSVTAIRITAFPSNTTSLTVNGSVYSSLPSGGIVVATNSSGAPSVAILVDPTNDSNPVSFSFVAIDNAGKESTATGTAVLNSSLVLTVSGTVWNDADGNLALNGSETGTNAGGPLFVNLVTGTGAVVASTSVNPNGSYTLSGVPASSTGLRLVLTSTASSVTPGGLPTNWVNTGESVDASNSATQSSMLGQIELSTGTGAIVAQNFGIEQLPTPGSGSASANNGGGNRPVTVPASAFTSTTPSTDTAPGSVTAIRLTAFPSNTTSLTVNGSVYSSLPTGGILIPTDENGAPTVAISVNPTDDGSSVVMLFVAVDNAGKESATTGTATLRAVSDLTPIIYARPSTVRNTSAITVVVDVLELLNVASSGPITVRVSKDDLVNLTFDASASRIDNRDVQNSFVEF